MASRFKYGPMTSPFKAPALAALAVAAAAGPAGPKADVSVSLDGFNLYDGQAVVTVGVPAYDLASANKVLALHAVIIPRGTALPDDPAALVNSDAPSASADVGDHQEGVSADLAVDLATFAPGTLLVAQVVVEIEADDPAPGAPTTSTPTTAQPATDAAPASATSPSA